MFKIVILGGGTGLSTLMKGLMLFPWEITAVVNVSDNGHSTGALRKEFDIPAVGDITKVMMAMSQKSDDVKNLFMYRFDKESSISDHSIKNLIMTALLEMKGDFAHSIPILCDLLDVKGNIYPVTEDNVDLVGLTSDGKEIDGETQITASKDRVKELRYDKPVKANPRVVKAIMDADLVVFSSGSLVTSILPNIIIPEIQEAIKKTTAKKLYICNVITQPGETDDYTVSNHIDNLEKYLGKGTFDAVIANNGKFKAAMLDFASSEGKAPVVIDRDTLAERNIELIEDNIVEVEDGYIRHDALKTAYLMFSYLMS